MSNVIYVDFKNRCRMEEPLKVIRSCEFEHDDGKVEIIKCVQARSIKDSSLVAIHLLNPTEGEIDTAFETASKDGFDLVVCHTEETWPNAKGAM